MRRCPIRLLLALAPWLLAGQAAAETPILQALRANDWPRASALAAAEPDALAPKLVTFIRLLNVGQASAAELAAFMAAHPGWPNQATLERRYAEALAEETDGAAALALCRGHAPQPGLGLLRCADAYAAAHDKPDAAAAARAAWVGALAAPDEVTAFLARWAWVPTPADEQARFSHLLAADPAAAERQLPRLAAPARALGTALLALRRGDAGALASLAALPADVRATPALLLAEARALRRSGATQEAAALWAGALPAAEAAVPPGQRAAWWVERDALARRLIATDPAQAYALADDGLLAPDQAVDADFLAGWIALQRKHDPARARAKFEALARLSHAAITQARAWYWLGRAAPDPATAQAAYRKAAAWPLTFYGQLAARACGLGEAGLRAAILAQHDPAATPAERTAFAQSEAARAAVILAGWEDKRRGADFLVQAIAPPASLGTRALAAGLALRLGLPDVAVQAARLAGRDGTVLPDSGWPMPVQPPTGAVPAALSLAVMRQESSFDPAIVSHAGAQGLMQLMPGTAQLVARTEHAPSGPLNDPAVNMRLGTAYLAGLLARFGGSLPEAIAAYNAGPARVAEWVAANGEAGRDPGSAEAVDWIEAIPFAETRNYVQRVLENRVDYAARQPPGG